MKPKKILYVDDEAMSLKYFDRLISPMAPVLTALSVKEGMAILQEQHADIAVLVSDQRMPGANGNELLRYARDTYPNIVRMMTTAYSELGEAIGAINDGEIYRYITKPWDLENLRADLKNALELATLRNERDSLLSEKMGVQQQELLAHRIVQLAITCAGFVGQAAERGLHAFLDSAQTTGCAMPQIDWRLLDHAQLMQLEAQRSIAIGKLLAQWQQTYDASGVDKSSPQALTVLAKSLHEHSQMRGDSLLISQRSTLTGVLDASPQEATTPAQAAYLAWLLWSGQAAHLSPVTDGWELRLMTPPTPETINGDWLARSVEHILQAARTT